MSPIATAHSIDWDEAEDVRGSAAPLAYSFASHLLLLGLLVVGQIHRPVSALDPDASLGYWSRTRRSGDLDLRQPDALRFRLFQTATAGGGGARGAAQPEPAIRAVKPAPNRAVHADGALSPPAPPASKRPAKGASAGEGDAASVGEGAMLPALQPDVALSDQLVVTKLVKPVYPERELQQGIAADILVALHVTPMGEIDEAFVQESRTNPPASPRAFELMALEALRQWRIRLPPSDEYRDGWWVSVPVEYRPTDSGFTGFAPALRDDGAQSPDS